MSGKERLFTCQLCRQTYQCGWSEEQALEEMRRNFGDIPPKDSATVCSPCLAKMTAYYATQNVAWVN